MHFDFIVSHIISNTNEIEIEVNEMITSESSVRLKSNVCYNINFKRDTQMTTHRVTTAQCNRTNRKKIFVNIKLH